VKLFSRVRGLATAVSRVRHHKVARYATLCVMIAAALLSAAIISSLTINLGPRVRERAEREGSRFLERPMQIGRLSLHIARGRVLLEDLTIAGSRPGDRPFFTAKRLSLSLNWANAFRRRPDITITSVELTDWEMLVEKWKDGHNFPDFTPDSDAGGPRPFTTTLRYLRAWRGQFTYLDHEAPWSIVAPNIDLNITNAEGYRGEARFTDGTVEIQDHLPMWTNMVARFTIDGSLLHLDRIDLESDGSRSVAIGSADLARWPEMQYDVQSRVHFPRMREIFFRNETWQLSGDGDFDGIFRLFKGGHELTGHFTSDVAGVDGYRFPSLFGSLEWTSRLFEVTDAGSELYGGLSSFDFSIKPLGSDERPTAVFDASYDEVDLVQISDLYELPGLRFAGTVSGRNRLEWTLGRFGENSSVGSVSVSPPEAAPMMTSSLAAARAADPNHSRHEWGPFGPVSLPAHVPVGGELRYSWTPDRVELGPSRFATERTHVSFEGTTDWGVDSRIPFHVTSSDWQESDQILAGILTNFGARTGVVAFGGRGEFEGSMTGAFRRPRVEGVFTGEDLRAWDTVWGDGVAEIVVENNYLTVNDGVVRLEGSEVHAEGLFSLGYPRGDGGDEIDARFRVTGRDLDGVRHAFGIDDYSVSGDLTGEFRLTGRYRTPFGFGAMTIANGTAYGESFEVGTASLRFDGEGIRLDGVRIAKGGSVVTGAAFVGWEGTYSFNADARDVPFATLEAFNSPRLQPSGRLEFVAGGSGTFVDPRYDVRFRINDLMAGEEPVGQVTGNLALRGNDLSGEFDVASPRLAISGTGRIALNVQADADLTFRFHESSLDPYVRLFVPQLSPYTTAVASGSVRVIGELANVDYLLIDATVDTLDMRLFDYAIHNDRPIRLALDNRLVRIDQLQLVGEDTSLAVEGQIALIDQTIAVRAEGDANLGILQGFFSNVRGSGQAKLAAGINGPLHEPVFSGSATISDGRVRHFSLPNSLDEINGTLRFDSSGIRLDDVDATFAEGRVRFGGLIGFDGYLPGELTVTARGKDIELRYPEGVRSTVDADLTLRGSIQAPTLGGLFLVKNATWAERVDTSGGLFDFDGALEATAGEISAIPVPIRYDIQIQVPSTLHIENNVARLVASADLQLAGTYERPLLFGRAEVDRGEITFEGRRYVVTRGAIDFTNPSRIEPFFDVEAETRVRVPGQTYRVIVSAAGTAERLQPQLSSDPPLPAADVVALLFSDVRRTQGSTDAELRALQNPNQAQTDILTTRATQLLANPVSSEVGRVVEQTFGVDTFQLSPTLIDPYSQSATLSASSINPSARVTVGKRISERVFLTYSRSVSSAINDEIFLLEYDENDRLSWILSRNEDSTYAIEVRVRHTF